MELKVSEAHLLELKVVAGFINFKVLLLTVVFSNFLRGCYYFSLEVTSSN